MRITIVSGSTRKERTSHRVSLALNNYLRDRGLQSEILDLKELNLPIFSERFMEMNSQPSNLMAVSTNLKQANAIIFVTPEYNGGITSALKNLIDIFGKQEFAGKPIGVATASTGVMGGVRAAYQLQQCILALQAYPQPQMLLTAEVTKQINERGEVINPLYNQKLDLFINSFLIFSKKLNAD